ncbi:hypothetical protein [Amycolatopsis anabasis]|uniref:hypothetical protein n=1 Tax=Amycolatopsis anabasis TaxID=1840409 RepID=UPI00131ADC87|nr:hypothetical protein [Amycolatopsis anabasis]
MNHTQPKSWSWAAWPISVLVNFTLGYARIVPYLMLLVVLDNTVFATFGWTQRDPTFNDGILAPLFVAAVSVLFVLAVFFLVNIFVARRSTLSAWWYWILNSALLLVPSIAVSIWPDLWRTIRWY